MKFVIAFISLLYCGGQCKAQNNSDLNVLLAVLQELQTIYTFNDFNLASLISINYTLSENECGQHLRIFLDGFSKGEHWALKMFDASAKPQSGLLQGNVMHIGNYDECISISHTSENSLIQGQYCAPQLKKHNKYGTDLDGGIFDILLTQNETHSGFDLVEIRKSFAICIPKSCSVQDIQEIFNNIEDVIQSPIHFHFAKQICTSGEPLELTTAAIISLVIFGLFGIIIVSSTVYDIWIYQRKLNGRKGFIAFSFYTNFRKLISTNRSDDTVKCLNGIRVISMLWILLGHRFMYLSFAPAINIFMLTEWKEHLENSIIVGATMAVDTFFTISGFLLVYLFMKSQARGVQFSLPMFYFHRILRLSPSLIMIVLFTATLQKYLAPGPYWYVMYEMLQKPCEEYWWPTILYVQNYVLSDDQAQCISQTWYLAVDTQLYFLSPMFLLPLVRWPKPTMAIMITACIAASFYIFEISWKKSLILVFFEQSNEQFKYLYAPTHVRFPPYFIGAIFGYFAFKSRTQPIKLCKSMVTLLWIAALVVMITIVGAHSVFCGKNFTVLESSIFNSVERPCWALALCTIIMLCMNNYGGTINKFLSHSLFTVLIRLNYNMYLLHLTVISFFVAHLQVPVYFNNFIGYHVIWGDYFYTLIAAVIWTLAFESPILALEKLIFPQRSRKSIQQNGHQRNDNIIIGIDVDQTGTQEFSSKRE